MSGPTDPSLSPNGRSGFFRRGLHRIPGFRLKRVSADEGLFQDLNQLSIDYAACYSDPDVALARGKAAALLRERSNVINRLARWWLCETTPAFTALSNEGVVHMSEPSDWPAAVWPQAHKDWAEANRLAILAKQFVEHGPRFYVGYQVVSMQAELLALVERLGHEPTLEHEPRTTFDLNVLGLSEARAKAVKDFETGAVTKARFRYLGGVGAGLLILAPFSLIALLVQGETAPGAEIGQAPGGNIGSVLGAQGLVLDAVACAIAGASGALVSVLTRVTNESLSLDFRVGSLMLFMLGLARPIVGAILALALYWATVGEVVPLAPPTADNARFAFFIAIGFIAGFSERYAQDMLLIRAPEQSDQTSTSSKQTPSGEPPPGGTEQPAVA